MSRALPIVQPPFAAPALPGAAPEVQPGPIEAALDDLWTTASPQFYRFRNVVRIVRLRRRFDLRPLRIDGLKLAIPTGQVPDCESCVELCCTGDDAIVSLRLRDVAKLMDLKREDLVSHERPSPTSTAKKPLTWARQSADESVFHRAFPVLARDATGTCMALNDERQCGLWPRWPMSCARYPYALDRYHGVIFYARGCRSTRTAPVEEAPLAVRRLVRATVDAYNERLKDIMLLAFCRPELAALGLMTHIDEQHLGHL